VAGNKALPGRFSAAERLWEQDCCGEGAGGDTCYVGVLEGSRGLWMAALRVVGW